MGGEVRVSLVNGEHPKVVQEMLGHASITLTMDTYSHVLPGMHLPFSIPNCASMPSMGRNSAGAVSVIGIPPGVGVHPHLRQRCAGRFPKYALHAGVGGRRP